MSTQLINSLNIRKNEYPKVGVFSVLCFFFGIYFGLIEITGFSLFLGIYSPSDLPLAIILGGVGGLLFYPFFTAVYVRTKAKFFSLYSLSIYLIVPALVIVSNIFFPRPEFVFLLVIFIIPLGLTGLQLFWATISNFFDPDQNKRFKTYFEFAFISGIAVAGFGTIGYLFLIPSIENLYYFAVGAAGASIIIQIIINTLFHSNSLSEKRKRNSGLTGFAFSSMWKNRYRFYFALFAMTGIVVIFFINFSFYTEVHANYESQVGYAKFFGLFNGSLVIFTFILKQFIVKRILSPYDSPYSSILSPLFIAITFLMGIAVYYGFGSNEFFAGFSILFVIVSLIKLISHSVHEAIELPSTGVLIKVTQVPDQDVFRRVLNGPVVMSGIIIAGALLHFILQIGSTKVIHFLLATLVLTLVWGFFNIRLLKSYQKELDTLIKKIKTSQSYMLQKIISLKDRIYKLSVLDSVEKMMFTLKIAENNYPSDFRNNLSYLIGNTPLPIKKYALQKINELNVIEFQRYLDRQIKQEQNEEYKQELMQLEQRFKKLSDIDKSGSNIFKMATSRSSDSRFLAANLVSFVDDDQHLSSLILLLRDFDPKVKKAALIAASKYQNRELVPILIENLSSQDYYSLAYDAIIKTGENSLDYIEQVFLNTKAEERILKRLVKAMGEMGSLKAFEELLSKIDNPSVEVSLQALQSLRNSKFRPQDQLLNRVLNSLVKVISILGQNFTFLASLKKDGIYENVAVAIEEDIRLNYHQIYLMLSLAYNHKTIDSMREYLENDDVQGNNFALEVLDNFIDNNLKSVLMPVLQHSNFFTKYKQLQNYFSLELVSHEEALSNILTSEYNQVSLWTKASILHSMMNDNEVKINNEIIACLFHSDSLVRESAACLIYDKDPDMFIELAERIEPSVRVYLDHTLAQLSYHQHHLIREKVFFLKSNWYFRNLRINILVDFAKNLIDEEMTAGEVTSISGEPSQLPVYFVYKGNIDIYENNEIVLSRTENEILDFLLLEQEGCKFYDMKCTNHAILFSMPRELLNLQLFDFPELEIVIQNYMTDFYKDKTKYQNKMTEEQLVS
jgi:ATP:ADP antiporter, AAA family